MVLNVTVSAPIPQHRSKMVPVQEELMRMHICEESTYGVALYRPSSVKIIFLRILTVAGGKSSRFLT